MDMFGGGWCPECSTGLGERICRAYFEQIFKQAFPKVKPPWLIGVKGKPLELDGYCEPLKIAFEHQGVQHYRSNSFFYKNPDEFRTLQQNDAMKVKLCKQNGIALLRIPQVGQLTPLRKLKDLIKSFAQCSGLLLPQNFDKLEVDLKQAYSIPWE